MKFDEKLQKISEKSQRRLDRTVIILGLSLLIASFASYFVLEAFGQEDLVKLDCPKGAYHGLDNHGNEACRDILTNEILEPEAVIMSDSDSEKITDSDAWIITDPETGEITLNDNQTSIVEISILALIGIVGGSIGFSAKKGKFEIFQRRDWSSVQKEQVRNGQYGKCNMCFTPPTHWKYDHIDGNKSNNELNNCQGLCPECFSVKTERDNRISIYQK
jgi:hypothetical protein